MFCIYGVINVEMGVDTGLVYNLQNLMYFSFVTRSPEGKSFHIRNMYTSDN